MRIYITKHARIRMAERSINKQNIEECLENYQTSRPGDGNKTIYDYVEKGYKISVSAVEENGTWIIASVWRVKL